MVSGHIFLPHITESFETQYWTDILETSLSTVFLRVCCIMLNNSHSGCMDTKSATKWTLIKSLKFVEKTHNHNGGWSRKQSSDSVQPGSYCIHMRILHYKTQCIIFPYQDSSDFPMLFVNLWARKVATQDLYSLSSKMSYHQISQSLKAVRLYVIMILSLWNLTCISAVLLPRCRQITEQFEKSNLSFADSRLHEILQ